MRALLLGVALAAILAAPASAAPSLVKVGDFSRLCTSPRRPTTRGSSSSRRPGVIRIVGGGVVPGRARRSTDSGDRGARAAVDGLPARLRPSGLFYVFLTAEGDGSLKVHELRRSADPNRADPAHAARCSRSPTRAPPTTTAASCSSGPTAPVRRAPATAAPASAQRPEPRAPSSARSCASTRARGAAAPATRSGRDLGVRPAQPVAVLVRPRDRRPGHRRRRRGRSARRSTGRRRRRRPQR